MDGDVKKSLFKYVSIRHDKANNYKQVNVAADTDNK